MADMRVKLLLDFVRRGRGAKEARDELKGVKTEAEKLRNTGGPDKLNASLDKTAGKARKAGTELDRARAKARALAATEIRGEPSGRTKSSAYAGLRDMMRPKERAASLMHATAAGAGAAALGGAGLAGVAGVGAIAAVGGKGVGDSLALEKSLYNVKRATDGSREELAAYRKEIENFSLATGKKAPELAEMLAAAGFAGRPKEELLDFMRYGAKAMTAWDTSAEQTGQALAEIGNIYQAKQKRIEEIGDAINTAADASAARETDLMEVLKRAGASGRQIGVTAEQTLALAAALKEVGTGPEVASTALQALYTNLSLGDEATKEFADGLKDIGTNSKKLQASVRKNATGAIVELLKKIETISDPLKKMEVLKKLFGREYADSIGALLNNLPGLERMLKLMNDPNNYKGSVAKNLSDRLQTDMSRLERAQAAIDSLSRRIGDPIKIMAGSLAESIVTLVDAGRKAAEAKEQLDAAAKRIAKGEGTAEDVDAVAGSPEGIKAVTQARVSQSKQAARDATAAHGNSQIALSPDAAADAYGETARKNMEKQRDALKAAAKAGTITNVQRQRLVALEQRLQDQASPPKPEMRIPADQADRRFTAGQETADRSRKEEAEKRLRILRDLGDKGASDRLNKPALDERGEGGFSRDFRPRLSNAPLPPVRPADLRAQFDVDLQPAAESTMLKYANGIKGAQGQTDAAAQQIGDSVKGRLAAVDASSAGQEAMSSYAKGIESGGAAAVAAAQRVAAQVRTALNVGATGGGGGRTARSTLSGALHDGVT